MYQISFAGHAGKILSQEYKIWVKNRGKKSQPDLRGKRRWSEINKSLPRYEMEWNRIKMFYSFVPDLFLYSVKYVNDQTTNHEVAA